MKNVLFLSCLFLSLFLCQILTAQRNLTVEGKAIIGSEMASDHTMTIVSPDSNSLWLYGPGGIGEGAMLRFGDADYVYLREDLDDALLLYAAHRFAMMGGNVGIGIMDPMVRLHLMGSLRVEDGQIQSNGNLILHPGTDGGSPDELLVLDGDGTQRFRFFPTSENETTLDFFTPNNGYIGYAGVYTDSLDMDFGTAVGNFSGKVHLVLNADPALTIAPPGKIGIGIENPSHMLSIQSPDEANLRLIGPDLAGHDAKLNFGDAQFVYLHEDEDDKLSIHASTRTAFTGGEVGIHTLNPQSPLHVIASGNNSFLNNGIVLENNQDAAGRNAIITTRVAGANSGDPFFALDVNNESGWSIGIDNDDDNKLKIDSRPDLVGGETRMTIDRDGKVGIGTTNPAENLHIANTGNIRVDGGEYQSWGPITLHPDVDSSGDDYVSIVNSYGSLQWLYVALDSNLSWIQYHTPRNHHVGYSGMLNGPKDMDFGTAFGNTNGKVNLVINASPKLTVDSTGFVGINTTSPKERLHLKFGNLRVDDGEIQSWGGLTFHPDVDTTGDDEIIFLDNLSQEVARIHNNGNVGIGTTSPSNKLTISESSAEDVVHAIGNGDKYYKVTSSNVGKAGIRMIRPGTSWWDFAIEDDAGRLRIRTTDNDSFNTSKLLAQFADTTLGSYVFTVYGDALATGGIWMNSDRRVKRNVLDLENPLDKIMQLQPKTYYYRHDDPQYGQLNFPKAKQMGLIAQDLEAVFPDLVGEYSDRSDDGSRPAVSPTKTMNYTGLIPVLVGAVKELKQNHQEQISQLEEENERLSEKTERLETRLSDQEARISELIEIVRAMEK